MTETEGMIQALSEKLIKVLPPAFLLLVILNIVFLGVTSYVFQHNSELRNAMIEKIINSCLKSNI